ncbi:hypothetical protein BGZ58_006710, partial [Dissophora ornata]
MPAQYSGSFRHGWRLELRLALDAKPQPGDDNDEEEDDDEDDDNCEGDNSQQQDAVDIQPGSEKDDADSSDKALSVYSESSAKRSQDA